MREGGQIIEDVRMWANEHDATMPSRSATAAAASLSEMHRDMPQIVGLGANLLKQMEIDVGRSQTMSRRLADASVRELLAVGAGRLETQERYEIVRRSLRNVLVQEAAGHEITRRGGIDPVRTLDRDPDNAGHGGKATAALRRIGVDVETLLGSMTEHDLARTSQGAYDKVSTIAHGPLVEAIEAGGRIMTPEQAAMNRQINPDVRTRPAVAVNPLRHLARHAPVRQPSFGRRMAQAQLAAGASR